MPRQQRQPGSGGRPDPGSELDKRLAHFLNFYKKIVRGDERWMRRFRRRSVPPFSTRFEFAMRLLDEINPEYWEIQRHQGQFRCVINEVVGPWVDSRAYAICVTIDLMMDYWENGWPED